MTRRKRRSHQHGEMLEEQEAGGRGSLLKKTVEALQDFRRNGLSYREIHEVTPWSLSTIHRYTHMIAPQVFYEPGVPLSEKLWRIFHPGITYPSPPESGQTGPPDTERTTIPSVPVAQASPSPVFRTLKVFSGTLVVSAKRPGVISFIVPSSSVGAVLDVTASGPAFIVRILSERQRNENQSWGTNTATWTSPLVSMISKELNLPQVGRWLLVIRCDSPPEAQILVSVEASLRVSINN